MRSARSMLPSELPGDPEASGATAAPADAALAVAAGGGAASSASASAGLAFEAVSSEVVG